jgi:uncharacterized protein (TIGR03545 family)
MTKWIRWQGVIAFVIVAGILAVFWLLILDGLVKRTIEKTGTLIMGAEVNVKDVDVRLYPLAVTLKRLEVTNPEAPTTNSFECGRIAFSLDSLNLLRRKTIINEMAVEGMRFDTPRKRAGWVKKREEKKAGEEKETLFELPIKTPNIKEILQNENLESVKLIETTQADLQKKKADWKQRMDEMPDKAKVDGYKARIEKIRLTQKDVLGMSGQLAEFRAVRRDIEQDIERVKQARAAFSNDLSAAKNIVERAERAPQEDIRRLRDKYSISPSGLANMSELLFKDSISSWVRTGVRWYNRLQPVVERAKAQKKQVTVVKPVRGKGVDVRFKEYRPLPDFLIDRIAVSAVTTAGDLAGTIRNITPDQNVLGIPTTFSLTGEKLTAAKAIAFTGALNHIIPAMPADTARLSVSGFRVRDIVLSKSKDLPIAMQDALVDFNINGSITQALKATLTANVNSARMNIGNAESTNPFVVSIRSALSKVSNFSISADVAGSLENYTMKISSDMDRILKNAVGSVVQEQSARLEKELKAAIQERTGGQLKELRESYGALTQQGNILDNIQNQLNQVLQDALKSAGGKLRLRK